MIWGKVVKPFEVDEGKRILPAGDWWPMSPADARHHLIRGNIEIPRPDMLQTVQELSNCAIVLIGEGERVREKLPNLYPGVPIDSYAGDKPEHDRFLLWDVSANLRLDLILTGFQLLSKWQIAIPLCDYGTLAEDIGTKEERARTMEIIPDLRIPTYDSRVIFARQCPEVDRLFELWKNGSQLQFLEALYQSMPIKNALPMNWVQ